MGPRRTLGKVGLVLLVLAAGAVAVVANLGILDSGVASEELGVVTATDLGTAAPATSDPGGGVATTAAEPGLTVGGDVDGTRVDDDHPDDDHPDDDHPDDDHKEGDRDRDKDPDHGKDHDDD